MGHGVWIGHLRLIGLGAAHRGDREIDGPALPRR
jgi:hypothetical protein